MTSNGLFRLAMVAIRRYSREPSSRAASARMLMGAALNILAEETSPGEAALGAAEVLADIARIERRDNKLLARARVAND